MLELYFRLVDGLQRRDVLVVCYTWPDFERKARALTNLFRERGLTTELVRGNTPAARAKIRTSGRLHVGFWNEYYSEALPRKYVCYNAEPLTLTRWNENEQWLQVLSKALEVWDYAPHHEPILNKLGVRHRHVPFGFAPFYHEEFQQDLAGQSIEEDIDVLFYGHLTERRAQLLKAIEAAGCHVYVVTYQNPARGAALNVLIARSKIALSIFAVDDPGSHNVDYARLDHLLSNNRFVIQERSPDNLRDAAFEQHVETCDYADIPERCAWYRAQREERHAKAAQSHNWFKTQRAWDQVIPFEATRALMDADAH